MPKTPKRDNLFLDGPVGRLEAILETPSAEAPRGAALVLHPHPQHGGTMHNKVAHTLARAFVLAGFETLRFNFRGTEGSDGQYDEGRGELDDALHALDWLRERHSDLPVWLGGFSFGAAIAVRAAAREPVDGLISIAPAISRFGGGLKRQPACPWLIVQGDEDELVDIEETVSWVDSLDPGPELLVLNGAEHFFHGRLVELRKALLQFIESSPD